MCDTNFCHLTPSQENYLKEIYLEVTEKGYAKITDIARALNVKKSSATAALNILSEKKLIHHVPYNQITMTDLGSEIAAVLIRRYETMISFFVNILKLKQSEAAENSCRIEHIMSEKLFKKMTLFYQFTKEFYETNSEYRKRLDTFLTQN
ncbi:MAG: metal-dependent transcriptional regulator [Puniceicoccales bacterium]|jgi:DtxR family Mn-dependent transcriptional regulator|nr:metal-dependent transcriptional regulator [Puniceicoccales bacterium]